MSFKDLPFDVNSASPYLLSANGTMTTSINISARATYISPTTFEKLVIRSAKTTSLKDVSTLKFGVTILFKAL